MKLSSLQVKALVKRNAEVRRRSVSKEHWYRPAMVRDLPRWEPTTLDKGWMF